MLKSGIQDSQIRKNNKNHRLLGIKKKSVF